MNKFIPIVIMLLFSQFAFGQKLVNLEKEDDIPTYSYPVNSMKNPAEVIKLKIENLSSGRPLGLNYYKNLQILRIEKCGLGSIEIDFDKYPMLQSLYISDSEYDTLIFKGTGAYFKKICLYDRHFYHFDFLPQLQALEDFHTSDTLTIAIDNLVANLLKLPKIQSISFYDGNIRELPASFGNFQKLDWFSLRSRDKNFDYSRLFERIKDIELNSLNLMYNQMTSLPATINLLKKIKQLHLGETSLTSLPNEIGELLQLEVLSATMSYLDTLPNNIIHLKNLKVLELMPCNFKTIPQVLYQMTWLEKLEVGAWEWFPTDEELKPLRKKLKGCKVNQFGF